MLAFALLFAVITGTTVAKEGDVDASKEAAAGNEPQEAWSEVRHNGRGYVSLDDVGRFYGLTFERDEKRARLTNGKIHLEFITGTKGLLLNGLQFYLSYAVLPWGEDRVIVSNFDLVNVIDPTLRPSSQRDPSQLQTVIINASHGGRDAGISGPWGREKDFTLDLALRLRKQLAGTPYRIMLTREGDFDLSVVDRFALAEAVKGEAIFVSLHLGNGNPNARGLEISTLPPPYTPATYDPADAKPDESFYPGNINDRESLALAVAIQGQALREKVRTLGLKRSRYEELKGIAVPAVYCRAGFITNKEDLKLLGQPEHLDRIAKVIAGGIQRYASVIEQGIEQHTLQRAEEPLIISNVEVFADQVRSLQGEKRRVRIDIRAHESTVVDPAKVDVQVYFFDLVNGKTLDLSAADPPAVEWISVLPDWKATDTEVMEVSYELPAMNEEEYKAFGQRFYYGFVIRLVYDGKLVDSYSEPTNLRRGLPHFTPVFP
ncbi:MAG: N-acetylmuramoyl-L-alanine amidase [Verrucomicrobiales bacterium]